MKSLVATGDTPHRSLSSLLATHAPGDELTRLHAMACIHMPRCPSIWPAFDQHLAILRSYRCQTTPAHLAGGLELHTAVVDEGAVVTVSTEGTGEGTGEGSSFFDTVEHPSHHLPCRLEHDAVPFAIRMSWICLLLLSPSPLAIVHGREEVDESVAAKRCHPLVHVS